METYKKVDLCLSDYEKFLRFCKANGIYAEPSYVNENLRHFEVRVDTPEIEEKCNKFLTTIY